MTAPNSSPDKFIRLSRPAQPVVKLTAGHEPSDQPVSAGEWVRLARPAPPVVELAAEPATPAPTCEAARS